MGIRSKLIAFAVGIAILAALVFDGYVLKTLGSELSAQTEANLALFLAEHDRKLSDAVTIAETVARARHDVFTDDALAWAYFKVGRVDEAWEASRRALRIGTRDPRILSHASQIEAALPRRH